MAKLVAIVTKIELNPSFLPRLLAKLTEELLHPYHPELHYMRGPGPKWREKHARAMA
jgi:hypothetical protein